MTLADTSVWVEHFRKTQSRLQSLLESGEVATHAFVLGELACGKLPRRGETLHDLRALPCLPTASEAEVNHFVDHHRLWGLGLGWVDFHLFASVRIGAARLWTLDRRLQKVAVKFGCALL